MGENNDIAQMLALLHELQGIDFVRQLRLITERHEFFPLKEEPLIYTVGSEGSDDYSPLLDAARKAVEHGYRVFILPNPKGFRTADYILVRKGVYKMYDLKTISGSSSIGNRLQESIGQTNRVLLNITTEYNPIALARSIRTYFERNPQAVEVLVYKGRKSISVLREDTVNGASFFKYFVAKYIQ
jgi:hypothetical protein